MSQKINSNHVRFHRYQRDSRRSQLVAERIRWETMDKVERKAAEVERGGKPGGGEGKCNCSYFFSLPRWPRPETKGDPTSNIQIRKLPRRSVRGPDYPRFSSPKATLSLWLSLLSRPLDEPLCLSILALRETTHDSSGWYSCPSSV